MGIEGVYKTAKSKLLSISGAKYLALGERNGEMKLILVVKDAKASSTQRDIAALDPNILGGYKMVVEEELLIGRPGPDEG